jgi:hypothetical protein
MWRAGAAVLDLRNILWRATGCDDRASLLVYDWVGVLPISVVIRGAFVTDKGTPVPEGQSLGPVSSMSAGLAVD